MKILNSLKSLKLVALLGICLSMFFFPSCSKKNNKPVPNKMQFLNAEDQIDTNFVNMELAQLIAERLPQDHFESESVEFLTGDGRQIVSSFPLRTDLNLPPAAYVFNYANGGGYAIIAADFRYEPFLAFGNNGSLNEGDSIPAAMYEWMMHNLENIDLIRNGSLYDKDKFQSAYSTWSYTIENMNLRGCCIQPKVYTPLPYDPCNNWDNHINESVGPLTYTAWGQGNYPTLFPYNDFNYLLNTSISCSGRKPLAGCVPIATAQILKHWSKPHPLHNYSAMPNFSATTASQNLVSVLADVTQLDADYGCTETAALSSKVSPVLKNVYGFASGGDFILYSNSERWNIRSNILNNRVVYAGGNNKVTYQDFIIFKTTKYTEAHAWLIDGYRRNELGCTTRFWFHMNWGYYGLYNVWFYESDWAPGNGRNFQYQRTIIKNIYP